MSLPWEPILGGGLDTVSGGGYHGVRLPLLPATLRMIAEGPARGGAWNVSSREVVFPAHGKITPLDWRRLDGGSE
ncbi:MAG: hypothetical protein D6812_08125 [Deltaproteobacteria bacterium]|nr:MAG: hypothetical protein D6812_08125 [Deltaproteobacteria bacterium]